MTTPDGPTLAEIIRDLTWDDIASDGIITIEEIEALLRSQGFDPNEYDYLYE